MTSPLLFSCTLLLYLASLLLGIGGLWLYAPSDSATAAKLIMATIIYLPLVISGLGVLLRDARLLTWLCFIVLFYFCGYVAQFTEPDRMLLSSLRLGVISLLFVVTMVYIRRLKQNS